MHSVRLLTTIAFAATLTFSLASLRAQDQSTGDPVADAARKAREQKKNAPKPKKVITDEDISPKPAEQPVATAPVTEGDAAQPANNEKPATAKPNANDKDKDKEKEDPNSEAAWRRRFAEMHRKISDAELELDVLQREAAKADLQYYSDPQKALQEQYSREEINKKTDAIDAKKKQIADLKQQLGGLEDQLRASGGDPGWAR